MNPTDLKDELRALKNTCSFMLQIVEKLLEEVEKEAPDNPRKRQNLKIKRVQKYDNYITSGKWKRKTGPRKKDI